MESKIGTLGYSSLLGLLAIVCIVIPVLSRLKELDLKNLKLTLEKIEEAKKEIYAKEESLKEASHVLAELIAANSTLTGVWGDEESNSYSKDLIRAKIKKLAKQMEFNAGEMEQILKYEKALSEVHAASKEEHDQKWHAFKQMLKNESEKMPNNQLRRTRSLRSLPCELGRC
jgi:DNA polymerase III gamma/tau subunit